MTIFNSILHVVSEKKVFEISANQRLLWPLDELEPYLAEMFLARSLSSVVTFCSDRPPFKMAAVTKNRKCKTQGFQYLMINTLECYQQTHTHDTGNNLTRIDDKNSMAPCFSYNKFKK
jgi:hypothetical protein